MQDYFDAVMFRRFWLRRRGLPWLRISSGGMQMESMGRVPADIAGPGTDRVPEPEYIAEAAETSEDVWAREQARYRGQGGGSGQRVLGGSQARRPSYAARAQT
jgi:hypothetical protein